MEMPRGKQSSNRLIFSYIFQWKLGDDLAKCHRQQRSPYQFLHCKEVTNLPVVTTFTEVVLNNRFRERNSVNSFYLVSQLLAFFILKYFLSKVTNWEQLKPEKKKMYWERWNLQRVTSVHATTTKTSVSSTAIDPTTGFCTHWVGHFNHNQRWRAPRPKSSASGLVFAISLSGSFKWW